MATVLIKLRADSGAVEMTGRKTSGIVLLVGGVALLVVSLSADFVGVGTSPGIGGDQLIVSYVSQDMR